NLVGCRGQAWSEPLPEVGARLRRTTGGARHFHSPRPPALDQEPVTPTESPRSTEPHQALYRRWRAQTFSEIVGQQAVVQTLRPAGRRRAPPQRRPIGPRLARDPLRRAAWHRQDVPRPDPREGAQLHDPPGRRPLRSLRGLRIDPRGPGE